jgi:long-chain acyl-CoA synthetase
MVAGYWDKPAESAQLRDADGWLRTGDVAFRDADGWTYLVDRKKDMIVASGYKVWPREVEDVLYAHPAVREAAVVGAPDAYRGETVAAFVALRPGQEVSADELVAHCRERLAAYKAPRTIELRDELPKTTSGKILRRELRA